MVNTVGLVVVGFLVILISDFIRRSWRNSRVDGKSILLPPGSMGFPLIGETLSLMIPSYSLELHPFFAKRFQRYGPIFRTSIAGRPVCISADSDFNRYLFQQEGKLVEMWYMDTLSKLFSLDGDSRINGPGIVHKYIRGLLLNNFGVENLRGKLLPQIEQVVNQTLISWSTQPTVEVKSAVASFVLEFAAKEFISHDAEKAVEAVKEPCAKFVAGFASFPLNIPGTTFHECLKGHKKVMKVIQDILKERRVHPDRNNGDVLDQIIKDMETEKFITESFAEQLIFGGLFATFETLSSILALAFKFLSDHPSVVDEMTAEQEAILRNREDPNSSLTWEEYKSMTFTLQVINEAVRIANIAPGIFRRTLQDISIKGFTIPKGWTMVMVTPALHLNPDTFSDPLEFNPRRWKDLDSQVISKNFMPFGGGSRQCAGAEFSKVFMATFFHVLLTKYRWTMVKEGKMVRLPILGFKDGIHISFSPKCFY